MRRTLAVLALSGLVATVAGSAAVLNVDGSTIQAGSASVACDTEGVNANWGLETDDNSVRSVRISEVSADCIGDEMFIEVYDGAGAVLFAKRQVVTGASNSFAIPAPYVTPESISSVKIWMEG
jgi:hypothetical protein